MASVGEPVAEQAFGMKLAPDFSQRIEADWSAEERWWNEEWGSRKTQI